MSAQTSAAPERIWVEIGGGDEFGAGDQPALSWWLPAGASRQLAYRIVSDDGVDTGRVDSDRQGHIELALFDRAGRRCRLRVRVWTDLGESAWSDPVSLDSGLAKDDDWVAQWIGVPEDAPAAKGHRPAYWLRTVFAVDELVPGVLSATALGVYEVFLNGVRVGDEELAPGYTQYARRVQHQRYDVSTLLRAGDNVLVVLLADGWYRGQVGMPRAADQFGRAIALRLQLETAPAAGDPAVIAATGPGWLVTESHVLAADLIGGQSEDRRRLDPQIHQPAFDTVGWRPAGPVDSSARIVRPVAPPIRRTAELRPVSVTTVAAGAAQLVDLGQNINGWTRLSRLGPAGSTITLRHGEHLDADGDLTTAHLDVNLPIMPDPLPLGQVDSVISAGRPDEAFEPRFTTHGFRYVRVEGLDRPLEPAEVTGVVVHSDLRRTGWFDCSDDRLNRLHEAAVWSLRGNVCGIPSDCPQRERAGWTGDWQIFAPTATFLYDVLGFTRSWLRDVRLDQRADGCIANVSPCPPAEGFDGPLGGLHGSAGWGDVIVSAPWELYQAYGDRRVLAENWDAMCRWVDFAAGRAAGARHPDRALARPEPAEHEEYLWDTGFHWGEWLEPGAEITDFRAFAGADKSEVATAYVHRSAVTVAEIGRILGRPAPEIERYRAVGRGARTAWQREFLGADGRIRVQTQASHVRALAFGLVPDAQRATVAARLAGLVRAAGDHLTTGFLSTPMLLPVLAAEGYLDVAYELLLQDTEPSWLTMIDRGATTMWERWNGVDREGSAHESLNHYSKGAVVSFLHRHVAGLSMTAPGYRRFRVAPRPGGGLTRARLRLESAFGPIEVEWRCRDEAFELEVVAPPGTQFEVVLPDGRSEYLGPGRHRWPPRA